VCQAAAGSLRKLELNSRQLRVIPVMLLRDCQSIEELDYSQNSINIVPPAIGEFMHLKLLNLSSNKLAELPPSLCHCFSLHTLLLAKNHFSIFPACLAEMKSLVHVVRRPKNYYFNKTSMLFMMEY
jgi:Leucine-rich repeat (LRR) protein